MWCPPVSQRVKQRVMQQVSQQIMPRKMRQLALFSTILLCSAGGMAGREAAAQPLAACEPPRGNEYLLLVLNQKQDTSDQLRQLLPSNAEITPCNYLNENVVRVSGFATADIANAWAQYVADMAGLQAFVARPAGAATTADAPTGSGTTGSGTTGSGTTGSTAPGTSSGFPTPTQIPASGGTSPPGPTPTGPGLAQGTTPGGTTSFPTPTQPAPTAAPATTPTPASLPATPQPLGTGYAVLVRYFNHPEVAADVHQVTSQPVGLVAYEQFPFLLAAYTTDANAATAILKTLNDRGFTAFIVDSRRAILLTPAVAGTEGRQG